MSKLWEAIAGLFVVVGGIVAAVLLRKSGDKNLEKAQEAKTEAQVYKEQKETLKEDVRQEMQELDKLEAEAEAITGNKIEGDTTSFIDRARSGKY